MGFDLSPARENADDYSVTIWGYGKLMLEPFGLGRVIGLLPHESDATKFYYENRDGVCPMYNDGFKVAQTEAEEMAQLARAAADTASEKDAAMLIRFAEFAEQSGGYAIH